MSKPPVELVVAHLVYTVFHKASFLACEVFVDKNSIPPKKMDVLFFVQFLKFTHL